MNTHDKLVAIARAEGIEFTPAGEPLFARDLPRWLEIKATPATRTAAQIAEDAANPTYPNRLGEPSSPEEVLCDRVDAEEKRIAGVAERDEERRMGA